MNARPQPIPFEPEWPAPHGRFIRDELPPAPVLPTDDVLGPVLARWVKDAAQSKAAPADYVFAALLSVAGALIGNTRWAGPNPSWKVPPIIWSVCIGRPSAGKSPALDAVLEPLRRVEAPIRQAAEIKREEWAERAEVAKIAELDWRERVKDAIKKGNPAPQKPDMADPGEQPHIMRLVVNDGTIEKLAHILSRQPRGTLQMRDELAGWLQGMTRYAGGGTDRPFWLEAWGGGGFTVERVTRDPLTIERLSIGVLGGIQPDRLKSLLIKADDDGLLARFLPIWPDPMPVTRADRFADGAVIEAAFARLLSLQMVTDEAGRERPWIVPFAPEAADMMHDFRVAVADWERDAEGLLLSFVGKMAGYAARIALVLAFLDMAAEGQEEPREITAGHFARAAHLVEAYLLPMARRAYADGLTPQERAARRLVQHIRDHGRSTFTTREVLRCELAGLSTSAELTPVLSLLEDAECIRFLAPDDSAKGGRPERRYTVNPYLLREVPR